MNKFFWVSTASTCLLLAACGGDGSSGGGASPAPSSAPSTPTPSYTLFANLTGDQNFSSSCAALSFGTYPPTVQPATPFGSGLTIAYTAATQTYSVSGDGIALSFGPNDLDPNGHGAYAKANPAGGTDRLAIGGPLSYTRGVFIATRRNGTPINYNCVIGVRTLVSDVPPIASAAYGSLVVSGSVYDSSSGTTNALSTQPSTVTFNVDLNTLRISSTLHLVGQNAAGARFDLGTYTGDGLIDSSTGGFTGGWTSTGRDVFGTFAGTFFGPQGKEVGLSYSIASRPTGQNQFTVNSAGFIYGVR